MNKTVIPYYFRQAEEDGVLFCARGPMSQEIIEMLESVLRSRVEQEQSDGSKTLRVFSVFVEQVQNIIRYSEERVHAPTGHGELGVGMVVVGHRQDHFFVSCGNLIKTSNRPHLERQLQTIQGMNREELRAHFKERGRSGPLPGSRGAGLGLIEMARKSSDFSFDFSDWDDFLTLFSIQVII
ncbi:MAG: SiaB family protein kinase [Magnetococcus sp. MYC-9]